MIFRAHVRSMMPLKNLSEKHEGNRQERSVASIASPIEKQLTEQFEFFWWVKTAMVWNFQMLVEQFIDMCWHEAPAAIATDVLAHYLTGLDTRANSCGEILAA